MSDGFSGEIIESESDSVPDTACWDVATLDPSCFYEFPRPVTGKEKVDGDVSIYAIETEEIVKTGNSFEGTRFGDKIGGSGSFGSLSLCSPVVAWASSGWKAFDGSLGGTEVRQAWTFGGATSTACGRFWLGYQGPIDRASEIRMVYKLSANDAWCELDRQESCGSQLVGGSTACGGESDSVRALVVCDARCRHNLVTPRPGLH